MQNRRILHYTIGEKLGQGGMGEVYLAHDAKLDRDVAVKFLPPSLQQNPEARVRLLREAQAASRLVHPNIVAIYAIENADGDDFIVMEYVPGRPLSDVIAAASMSLPEALELGRQIADALAVAHDTGVVHRDVKSSNILVTERGQAKILDFGLATFYGATQVTDAGTTMGTANYMSPEQTEGRPIDHRSDLFSFGVVLYEMVTGRRPFDGDSRNAVAYAICHHTPEPLARYKSGVPIGLENIVTKALRKDPTERYQSAADMMADIKVAARESGPGSTASQQPHPQQPYGAPPPTPQTPFEGVGAPQPPYAPQTPQGSTPASPLTPSAGAPQTPSYAQPQPPAPAHTNQPPLTPSSPSAPYAGAAPPSQPHGVSPAKPRTNMIAIVSIIVGGLIAITAIVAPRLGQKQGRTTATNAPPSVGGDATITESSVNDTQSDIVKIAVLPFRNQGTSDDAYFADGVTDEITARLASVRDLGVLARSSVEKYKDSRKAVDDIGRELGADYVLEGTVRWERGAGDVDRVRVTPQLVRVADGTNVWGDVYDEPMTAVFKVQSNIAKAVVGQLDVALNEPEQQALDSAPTDNMEAYDAYLKGLGLYGNYNSEDDMRVAVNLFEKATSLDPDFLMAWVRLSETHADMIWFTLDQSENRVEASRRAAERALEIDPNSPDARWGMGWYYYHAKRDLKNALRYLEPVLEERPNSAPAHSAVAYVQRRQGLWDEALANLIRATELNPSAYTEWGSVGETYTIIGQYAKSRPYLDRCRELRPEFPFSRVYKIMGYILEGDLLKARNEARALTELFPVFAGLRCQIEYLLREYDTYFELAQTADGIDNNSIYWPQAYDDAFAYLAMGDDTSARARFAAAKEHLLDRLNENPNDFRYHGSLGVVYAGLGMEVEALQHAERAVTLLPPASDAVRSGQRRWQLALTMMLLEDDDAAIDQLELILARPAFYSASYFRNIPALDPLREHPRFQALLGVQ